MSAIVSGHGVGFQMTVCKLLEKKKKIDFLCSRPSWKVRKFQVLVVQRRQRNAIMVCYFKPIALCSSPWGKIKRRSSVRACDGCRHPHFQGSSSFPNDITSRTKWGCWAHRLAWRMRPSVNKFGHYSLLEVLLKKKGKGVVTMATRLKFKFKILAMLLKTRSTKTTAT